MMKIFNGCMSIPIYIDERMYQLGITEWLMWEPSKAPHIVIVGSTGSGKTYFSKSLLGKLALYGEKPQLYVCDFKGDEDFSFLCGCKKFYRYTACEQGLEEFYQCFLNRQSGKSSERMMLVLFFDEWASYLNFVGKKKAEEEKGKLSNLLMLGRSFNVHVIISQQRADAQYFSTARDNFNLVIGLGNLSPESKEMLFHDYKEEMEANCGRGMGYTLSNGMNLKKILVPTITNEKKLHNAILSIVSN